MDAPSRIPPHNLEAETSVLGSILIDNAAYFEIEGRLRPEMFYKEANRKIFAAVEALVARGSPADTVTLVEELRTRNQIDEVGGVAYIVGLADAVPTSVYAKHYADIVKEKSTLRGLISVSQRIMQLAFDEAAPVNELMDRAESLIFEVSGEDRKGDFEIMRELVLDTFEEIQRLAQGQGISTGLPTGFRDLDEMTTGLQPGSLNVLAARPSMGKCLTAHTLIDDPHTGERLRLEEFIGQRRSCVFGVSDAGEVRPTRISAWIDSGTKPVFRVVTKLGRQVEVTGHHPFLTVVGWTPLHDLHIGSKVAVPRAMPCFGDDAQTPFALVRLIAYFIAEGGLTDSSPEWTNTDPALIADFKNILAEHFPELSVRQERITYVVARAHKPGQQKNRANPLTEFLRELKLWGKLAEQKQFPEMVWRLNRERLAEFMRILFSCDASIYALNKRARIEFTVSSEQLARDVQHALTRFGIIAKLWQKTARSWRLEITEPESVNTYQREIAWFGEKAKRKFEYSDGHSNKGHVPKEVWPLIRDCAAQAGLSLSQLAIQAGEIRQTAGFNPHCNRNVLRQRLVAYNQVLNDQRLQMLASTDLYWDEIVSIEALEAQQVYDLTVPDGANFIAQDVCVHNTAFALSIAQNVSIRQGKTVALFSLEMPATQLVLRMMCAEARVDMNRVRSGQLTDADFQRLIQAADKLSNTNMFIDDAAELNVIELRSRARRLMTDYDLGLIVIDYLQLMSGQPGRGFGGDNRQQEIAVISRGLKALARELNIPVLVLSQLSRQVESRPNHRPMLSDLRESGAIEQDADLVAFIYRDEYYDKASEKQGIAEIIIGKQRNGPVGTVELQFHAQHVRFNDLVRDIV